MGSLAIFLVLTISVLCADAALVRVPQGRMPINPDEGRFFEPSTVELVTVLFRHGDRTPDRFYPKDPYKNETFYPVGLGELTNQGKRKEYAIGKALRQRYNHFLGDTVSQTKLIARSSDVHRTKRSLLLVLASLFPPKGSQVWDWTLNWQPIETFYTPNKDDTVFLGAFCVKMRELMDEYINSPDFQVKWQKDKEVLDFISQNSGLIFRDYANIMPLYYNLLGEQDWGLQLPEWTKSVYPAAMEDLLVEFYRTMSVTPQMRRFTAGFMMRSIISEMLGKIRGETPADRKLYLYSGHELNLAFLQLLLGVYDDKAPPFGAYMIFELHKINGKYAVKILYQDYTSYPLPKIKVLKVPGCQTLCPIEKFVDLVSDFLPSDEDKCGGSNTKLFFS